ncbi:putative undecaprenyl-diphosphatase YbjG [compost metagenome]
MSVLDRSIVEWLNQNRIPALDKFFIFITDTVYAVPVIMAMIFIWLLCFKVKNKMKVNLIQAIVTFSLNTVVITILKYAIGRQRPYINDNLIIKITSGGSPSFPSGHTADAFIVAILFSQLFPEKIWSRFLIWLWAITIAYTRIALGVHYLSDVIGGVIISSFIGISLNRFFKNRFYSGQKSVARE